MAKRTTLVLERQELALKRIIQLWRGIKYVLMKAREERKKYLD